MEKTLDAECHRCTRVVIGPPGLCLSGDSLSEAGASGPGAKPRAPKTWCELTKVISTLISWLRKMLAKFPLFGAATLPTPVLLLFPPPSPSQVSSVAPLPTRVSLVLCGSAVFPFPSLLHLTKVVSIPFSVLLCSPGLWSRACSRHSRTSRVLPPHPRPNPLDCASTREAVSASSRPGSRSR